MITCKVTDHTTIVGGPRATPVSGKNSAGGICLAMRKLDSTTLMNEYGEYPVSYDVQPAHDPKFEYLESSLVLNATVNVQVTYTVVEKSVNDIKDTLKAEAETVFAQTKDGGITFQTKTYKSDNNMREYLNAAKTRLADGDTLPAGFGFETADGSEVVVMDAATIRQFSSDMFDMINGAFATLKVSLATIDACTTVAELRAL